MSTTSFSPINVRIVLQGGGAKIVSHLAALEEIAKLEQRNVIKVTRIAGTSAGAISAALFALGAERVTAFRQSLSDKKDMLIQRFQPPSVPSMLWTVYREKPIWDMTLLRELLKPHITEHDTFKNTRIPLTVTCADLADWSQKDFSSENTPDSSILAKILDSSAVPFAFRVWNKQQGSLLLDGGLCDNLPVNSIGGNANDGPIVAIGFKKPIQASPTRLHSFAIALLDIAIRNAEARAISQLPENHVLLLPEPSGTFDIKTALNEGLGAAYLLAREITKAFFHSFAESQRDEVAVIVQQKDVWMQADRVSKQLMELVGDVYLRQHNRKNVLYSNAVYEVTASSLDERGGSQARDQLRIESTFWTLDEKLDCLAFAANRPDGAKFDGMMEIRVWSENGTPVVLIPIPMLRRDESPQLRRICVFFAEPLPPRSGPYKVQLVDQPRHILHDLVEHGMDEIGFSLPRSSEPVRVHLVTHVPKIFGSIMIQSAPESAATGRVMTAAEKTEYITPRNYQTVGWVGEAVPPGQLLLARITKS